MSTPGNPLTTMGSALDRYAQMQQEAIKTAASINQSDDEDNDEDESGGE
jgi:hypothetical protein